MAENNPDKTNPDKELQVIFSALDDQRRLIAAGKVQRWDVVKWGSNGQRGAGHSCDVNSIQGSFQSLWISRAVQSHSVSISLGGGLRKLGVSVIL